MEENVREASNLIINLGEDGESIVFTLSDDDVRLSKVMTRESAIQIMQDFAEIAGITEGE
jgi:hypothetical protein